MPSIRNVGGKIRYNIERLDGGLNTKVSPSKIDPFESPDCLNVVYDDDGAVTTRGGSQKFNTTAVSLASTPVGYGVRYNGTKVIAAGNSLFYATSPSATTFIEVTAAANKIISSSAVGVVYQDLLFISDGTNGPWKYGGAQSFYKMGIQAPTGGSATSYAISTNAAGAFTMAIGINISNLYKMSFVNSQGVEGEMANLGAATVPGTAAQGYNIIMTSLPVGSSLAGVNQRYIYRISYDTTSQTEISPARKIGTLSDNTTTTFTDNTPIGAEGKLGIEDGSEPTPFTTIALHKDRLFFDDSSNRSLLRYTNFQNPFISEAENFEPIDNGDGEDIIAIGSQDDVVVAFKENKAAGIITQDPSDDLTWSKQEIAANLGIIGPRAFTKFQNGLVFIGRQNNKITGFHYLTGLNVIDTNDGRLRSTSISEKIEPNLFQELDPTYWENAALFNFENRLYSAMTYANSTYNNRIFWLDLNKVGTQGQPGTWSLWSGINAYNFFSDGNTLFSCDSTFSTGFIRALNQENYNDDGAAINSYFWTKQIGGEDDGSLDAYIKDLRELYVWRGMLGAYDMTVKYRVDGDTGAGTEFDLTLDQDAGSVWGSFVWGTGHWASTFAEAETRIPIGRTQFRRVQVGFDNQNTINQGFKVHRLEIGMNVRRPR